MKVYRLSLEDGFIVNWISFYRPAFPSKSQDEALAQHLDTGIDSSTRGLTYLCLLKWFVDSDWVHSGGEFWIVSIGTTTTTTHKSVIY